MQRDYSPVQTSPTQALSDDNSSDSDGLLKEEKTFQLQGHRKTFWRRHAVIICGHLCVFVLYTTIVQVLIAACWRWQMLLGTSPKSLLYSPANEALHWKLHSFDSGDGHEGPYSGYPRHDLDKAWEDLLGNMNVRFQLEDLKVWGRDVDAVALPDGSGYLGTLNVYHEIHCVKWMHTYMYQEFYWPDLDDHQREENRLHSGIISTSYAEHLFGWLIDG
ncbi:MAG: hypothetical protein LQ347_001803 [Umbilicaria vellea]|nr:MAG: hypothetical protein LQ347_001803 [Umbilicaria vellea]